MAAEQVHRLGPLEPQKNLGVLNEHVLIRKVRKENLNVLIPVLVLPMT